MNTSGVGRATLIVMRGRVSVLVCVALSLAACGGGRSGTTTTAGTSSTEAWAGGVCTAVTTYQQALQNAAKAFTKNPSKAGIDHALSGAEQATHDLSTTLHGLGKPDTPAGETARTTVDDLATKISGDVDTIKQAASSGGALQAASTISTTLGSMKTSITAAVHKLENLDGGALKSAFASAPSCATLKSKK
jgi:hypothetical protein